MFKRKTTLTILIIIILASFGAVAYAMTPSARDLLVAAATSMEETTSGHAIVTFEASLPEQSGTGTVDVWGQLDVGPNGEPAFRVEILDASLTGDGSDELPVVNGTTAVSDGVNFWAYDPVDNRVLVGTWDELAEKMAEAHAGAKFDHEDVERDFNPEEIDFPENAEEAVDMLLEYVIAERAGGETVGEYAANTVRLIPIPEQMPDEVRANGGLVNLWIRDGDNVPLGAEYIGGLIGEGRMTATLLELNIGIDPTTFTFNIPEGAEVITLDDLEEMLPEEISEEEAAAIADFALLSPTDLPVEAVLLNTTNMRGAVVQRYSLPDSQSFTVAQGANADAATPDREGQAITVRGFEGTLFTDDDGSRTLLTWQENGLTFWIGGDLTLEQVIAIADSLQ